MKISVPGWVTVVENGQAFAELVYVEKEIVVGGGVTFQADTRLPLMMSVDYIEGDTVVGSIVGTDETKKVPQNKILDYLPPYQFSSHRASASQAEAFSKYFEGKV